MNTVTKKQVDESIVSTEIQVIELVGKKHLIVAVALKNGFTIVESSTCVDPNNFCEEIGKGICLDRIKNKIWMLEGYNLQTELSKN